ncbi:MAG: hypothetical protein MUO63_09205 [Desulfobulbaceae bacterium]|nr:hypothetical protein [Desulfobulbaceae bacterium]
MLDFAWRGVRRFRQINFSLKKNHHQFRHQDFWFSKLNLSPFLLLKQQKPKADLTPFTSQELLTKAKSILDPFIECLNVKPNPFLCIFALLDILNWFIP